MFLFAPSKSWDAARSAAPSRKTEVCSLVYPKHLFCYIPLEKGVRMKLQHGAKRYVDVISRRYADGRVESLIICWSDERSFQVERIVGKPQSCTFPSSPGRMLRCTVIIDGVKTQLFLEIGKDSTDNASRWYFEQRSSLQPWKIKAQRRCCKTPLRYGWLRRLEETW